MSEKLWLKNYPVGVIHDIDVSSETLIDLFDKVCKQNSNNEAISCHDVILTFAEVNQLVNKFANGLVKLGVNKGDRVAIIMPNTLQYVISLFAILKLGAVVVNINPLYTEIEMAYILQDSGTKLAIIFDLIAHKLNLLYNKNNLKHIVVTSIGDLYPFIKRNIMHFIIKYIKRNNSKYTYPATNFTSLIDNDEFVDTHNKFTPHYQDLAFIQYTGATTGKPKGAMLSHYNVVANIHQIHAWLKPQCTNLSEQIVINCLPLYHIFSLTANLFTFFFCGSKNVMITNPRDTKELVNTLVKSNFTIFNALDTLYNHLLSSPDFNAHKYPFFKYSVAGGMPSRETVANNWCKATGVVPSNCYGMTETSPAITMNFMSIAENKFDGSVGFPIPSTEIQIRGLTNNEELPFGETGLIWVRGPQVMLAYWNAPEQTAKVIDKHNWLNTGDIGYLNPKGKLFISSRQSDMIIVSGFNVYPVEIENAIDSILYIKESAVIGIDDPTSGEKVVAFVVFKENKFMLENEIILNLKKQLTSYKIPREIIIQQYDLPKTLLGKIDKKALHQQYFKGNTI